MHLKVILFYDDTMLLTTVCTFYASYAFCIYIFILIDEAYKTSVGYVCLWEGMYSGFKLIHLFNSCYHMVERSSEVSLSRFNDTKMENFKDKNGCYNAAIQGMDRDKTITY